MVVDAVVVDAVVAARVVVAAGAEGGAAADGSGGSAVAVAALVVSAPSAPGITATAALGAALSLNGAAELTSSVKPPSPPGAKVLGTWVVDSATSGRRQSAAAASLRHPSGARSPLGPRGSA